MDKPSAAQMHEEARRLYGVVPNFFKETGAYTAAPAAVYLIADEALMNGVLSRREQQAVLLELARIHDSRYDAVVHARMALDAGLSPTLVGQLLDGKAVDDTRLQALVEATRRSCEKRAWLTPDDIKQLRNQGVTRGDLYEIFALTGMKKMTAFTHHISNFAVEAPLKPIDDQLGNRFQKPKTTRRQRLFVG